MRYQSLPFLFAFICLPLFAQTLEPDATIKGDSSKAEITLPTLKIPMPKFSGLIQVWSLYDSTNYAKANFRIRRANLKVSGQVSPEIRYFVMIDPAKSIKDGPVKKDNDNKILQDVGIAYTIVDGLEFTIGQFKTPTTAETLLPAAALPFPERSITGRAFGTRREMGAMLSYKYDLLKLALMASNGHNANTADSDTQKDLHGRVDLNFSPKFSVGTFASYGNSRATQTHKNGANIAAKLANFFFNAEGGVGKIEDTKTSGFFTEVGYEWQRLKPALRFEYFSAASTISNLYTAGFTYTLIPKGAEIQLAYTYLKNGTTEVGIPIPLANQNGNLLVANFQVEF